jgi:hypothetical protein
VTAKLGMELTKGMEYTRVWPVFNSSSGSDRGHHDNWQPAMFSMTLLQMSRSVGANDRVNEVSYWI